jgi:lipopolysaccharide exporter
MAEAPGENLPSLTRRAIRGVAWTLPTSLAARIVGLVGTLLLARYLAPAEYGEASAAWILMVTASSVTTFGVGIYLVSNRDVSRAEAFHATCWFLIVGVAAIAAAIALAGPLGAWSDTPDLGHYMPVFAVSTALDRLVFVPERMLVRQLRFRWLSLARAFGELTYTGTSLGLAASGVGAMAIAWGNLARSAVRFFTIVPAVDVREWLEPHRLRMRTMLKIVGYGINVSVASIATFAMRRWDNLLVSRYFGPATMGAYNYAYNLADTPSVAVGEQMSDVIAASFPHMEPEQRAEAVVRSCTMISLIMFPLAFGLGAVAPTVVDALFDRKWANVGIMLVYLAILSAPRPLAQIVLSYFYACQRPRVVMWLECISLAAIVVSISTVGRIGILWTCGAVGTVFVGRTLATMWTANRLDGIRMSSFLVPLIRPLIACGGMVAAVLAVRPALHGLSPAARLIAEVAVGATVYVALALVVARSASRELIRLVVSALSRRAS